MVATSSRAGLFSSFQIAFCQLPSVGLKAHPLPGMGSSHYDVRVLRRFPCAMSQVGASISRFKLCPVHVVEWQRPRRWPVRAKRAAKARRRDTDYAFAIIASRFRFVTHAFAPKQ